jgi:hypothetical protein
MSRYSGYIRTLWGEKDVKPLEQEEPKAPLEMTYKINEYQSSKNFFYLGVPYHPDEEIEDIFLHVLGKTMKDIVRDNIEKGEINK